jgi:hypothetical protein
VVVDLHPDDRVHVRRVPPRLHLAILVHPFEQLAQLAVAAHREVDVHLLDRLRRREPRLAHGFGRDGLLDPLLRLRVERGVVVQVAHVRTTTERASLSWNDCRRESRSGQR